MLLTALTEIRRRKLPHPPLTFVWPVQEEVGLLGARYMDLKKLGDPQLCFNWDGAPSDVATVGATGGVEVNIRIVGARQSCRGAARARHQRDRRRGDGDRRFRGRRLARFGRQREPHGNQQHRNRVRGRRHERRRAGAAIKAEVRSHDPQFRKQIIAAYKTAFEKAAKSLKNDAGATGRIEFNVFQKYESFRIADDSPVVQTAMRAIELAGKTRRFAPPTAGWMPTG